MTEKMTNGLKWGKIDYIFERRKEYEEKNYNHKQRERKWWKIYR